MVSMSAATGQTLPSVPGRAMAGVGGVLIAIAAAKLVIHLYASHYYGYFVDELYYLACSRHLAWGYVDQPPLIALIAWFERHVLGDSLAAIRFLPALAGACEVLLTGLIARELGGGSYASAVAAIAVLASPGILSIDNFLSMNAFEPLIWMGCVWLLLRIWNTGNARLWIWFGILCGVGLENKYSMLIFGAGIVAGLLLTPKRRAFAGPWPWIAAAIAFLLFLPNLLWNIQHHFPFLELQANIRRSGRDVALSPVQFFLQEALVMNPLTLPVWLAGLWFFFGSRQGKPFRALGWSWVFTALVITFRSPRIYYLFPAFPLLFAGGAVALQDGGGGKNAWLRRPWARVLLPALIVLAGAILSPLGIPVLSPERFIRYSKALGVTQPAIEMHRLGPLPQIFADQFGWEEMAASVARIYNALPEPVRSRTAIFGQNYGQAGAIDFFGPRYGLPPAISGHQNYFLWGPRGYSGESMIVMDDREETLKGLFDHVEKAGHVEHPYSMPGEHFDVFYCSGPHQTLQELWPRIKNWN
jgi:4-amino-4-deoxy-L-arabinose transferase-like glycosyltransferase